MLRQGLVLLVMIALSGCVSRIDRIHTEFLSSSCIKPYYDYHYRTCKTIKFVVNDRQFEVPENFETDLASIPKIAWIIMAPAHSSLIRPAIVHDWFYRKTCEFTREETDLIFYHMLKNDGIDSTEAAIMYYAVRWFGGQYYKEQYCEAKFKGMDKEVRGTRLASLLGHRGHLDNWVWSQPD